MLQAALQLVASGAATSSDALARSLAVSPEMGRALMDRLARMGYVCLTGIGCAGQCAGCSERTACLASTRVWELTEKGRRAVSPH